MDVISELYKLTTQGDAFCQMSADCDILWLRGRISAGEYRRLEDAVFGYGNKNGETLFKLGFQCAWNLSRQCNAIAEAFDILEDR